MAKRPSYVKSKHLSYLDELRESGETNMYGAKAYLLKEFAEDLLDSETAGNILTYWMNTFSDDDR